MSVQRDIALEVNGALSYPACDNPYIAELTHKHDCKRAYSVVVIDLSSQAEAVAIHVRGWTKSRFLSWLSQFGDVMRVRDDGTGERYSFASRAGRWSGFWFTKDGDLALPLSIGHSHLRVILVKMGRS